MATGVENVVDLLLDRETSHILYVDDDECAGVVVTTLLRRVMGFKNLHVFTSSDDFMARVRALPEKPFVILLDIHMKPHTGFEVLKMLRTDDDYKESRVIALTASVTVEERKIIKEVGFYGLISKPVMIETFPQVFEKTVQKGSW